MAKKILTVIIPTFNMEKYLERCLSSLIVDVEMMDTLEVLVVNDGSKDRSSEIAHRYESRFPETFKVIDKQNGNYGSCINAALPIANGKYIKILDADDWFDNKVFQEYMLFLDSVNVDLIFSGMSMIDESDNVIGKYCFEDRLSNMTTLSFKEYSVRMNGAGIYMQNVAYRLQCLKDINYRQTEGISYTDQEWLYIPLFAVRSVAYFPQSVYFYLVGRSGQTVNPGAHNKNMWMEVDVTKSIVKAYVSNKSSIHDTEISQYMFGRMMSRVRFLYSTYLLSARSRLNKAEIIEFDKFLKNTDNYAYQMANSISAKFGVKYVQLWRKKYGTTFIYRIMSLFHH